MNMMISSPEFWYQIEEFFGKSGGIYVLSCLDEEGNEIPISRLLGIDPSGVLYIGMASSFLDRVIDLKKSLSPKHASRAHECGARYKEHQGISSSFSYERLQVNLIGSSEPRATEREALQSYMTKFGELPPLNRVG